VNSPNSPQGTPAPTPTDMEARLLAEGLVSLAAVAAKLPRVRGKRVCASTIVRWILRGKVAGDKHVHLDGCRLGGPGWWTSWAAVARFAAELTEARKRTRKPRGAARFRDAAGLLVAFGLSAVAWVCG